MLNNILKLEGAKKLNKTEQKSINGGICVGCPIPKVCGGDKSFIYINGIKQCCFVPSTGTYIC